jgi:hypothetical protein
MKKCIKVEIADNLMTAISYSMKYFEEKFASRPTSLYLSRDNYIFFKNEVEKLVLKNGYCYSSKIKTFTYKGCKIKHTSRLDDSEIYLEEDESVPQA